MPNENYIKFQKEEKLIKNPLKTKNSRKTVFLNDLQVKSPKIMPFKEAAKYKLAKFHPELNFIDYV